MNNKDRKCTVILLSTAVMLLISGTFFPSFFKYIWPKFVPFVLQNTGSSVIWLTYFLIFAFLGAAIGLLLDAYAGCVIHCLKAGCEKTFKKRKKK